MTDMTTDKTVMVLAQACNDMDSLYTLLKAIPKKKRKELIIFKLVFANSGGKVDYKRKQTYAQYKAEQKRKVKK